MVHYSNTMVTAQKLIYITHTSTTGIRREIKGDSVRFIDEKGAVIKDAETIERFSSIYIPPAWENVWISPLANSHIQAIGYDQKGRKQYVYHPKWIEQSQEHKFEKVLSFAEKLPKLRKTVREHMELRGLPREKVLATIVWLLQHTFIRIGNKEYAEKYNSYGLTTLRNKHVDLNSKTVTFSFRGKKGVHHEVDVENQRVVKTIQKCIELPGYELFQYLDEDKKRKKIDSADVNEYLHEITREEITAKDFRTWGGTMLGALSLYELGDFDTKQIMKKNISKAVKNVSVHLRNTTTVCRKYYIHPKIVTSYQKQILIPYFEAYYRKGMSPVHVPRRGLTKEENALYQLLSL